MRQLTLKIKMIINMIKILIELELDHFMQSRPLFGVVIQEVSLELVF